MPLTTVTSAPAIGAVLDPLVARDPVRHTIFATIAADVRAGSEGWCAHDGGAVAARSDADRPVSVTAGWPDLAALVSAISGLGPVCSVGGDPDTVAALATALARPVRHRVGERLFRCDDVTPPARVPGRARRAEPHDAELIAAWRSPYLVDVFGFVPPGADLASWSRRMVEEGTWLWEHPAGRPVAQATVRPPLGGVVRIGPVYTPPKYRGRGYASAVTAHAAHVALADGSVPVLMTDLANPTSNKIYQAIGFRPVGDRASVWFG